MPRLRRTLTQTPRAPLRPGNGPLIPAEAARREALVRAVLTGAVLPLVSERLAERSGAQLGDAPRARAPGRGRLLGSESR